LQFPEKREFFLEGRGLFEFGRGTCPGQKPHRSDFSCLRRTVRERDLRWRLGRL
jgi:hypothetical protein